MVGGHGGGSHENSRMGQFDMMGCWAFNRLGHFARRRLASSSMVGASTYLKHLDRQIHKDRLIHITPYSKLLPPYHSILH